MQNDIVTRLRATETVGTPLMPWHVTPNEAADEIERLRELVEHLSAQVRLQMKANDKAWEAYKEVVGDD